MGRKKKKQSKPWCWYCNREFDDEKILIQHQKAKHFKCHICHKKLYTGPGLSIHCMQVHKEAIDKVPNSLPNRSNIEIEIYGMEGIPEEDLKEHERQKHGRPHSPSSGEEESAPKKPRPLLEITTSMPPSLQSVQPHIPPTAASSSSPGIPPHMAPGAPMMHHPPHLPPHLMGGPHGHPPMGGGAPPQHHPHHPGGPPPPPPFMPPGMHMMGPMGPMAPPPGTAPMATPPLANAQPPPPSKPLFPAAAAVAAAAGASNNQSTPVGADFKPLTGSSGGSQIGPVKPTFPAYSANSSVTSTASTTNETTSVSTAPSNSKPALINTTSASSRIIHPQEDISLEERRAMMPQYQPPASLRAPPSTTLTTPVSSVVSSAPSVGIPVPVSTAVSTAANAVAAAASAAAAATIAMAAGVGPPHPQVMGVAAQTRHLSPYPGATAASVAAAAAMLHGGGAMMRPPPMGLPPGLLHGGPLGHPYGTAPGHPPPPHHHPGAAFHPGPGGVPPHPPHHHHHPGPPPSMLAPMMHPRFRWGYFPLL
ncbi:BUB3-interacting and GLEBS motif-containing protein ZNF207 isoform X2 [Ischnura elegans]|uniref:BUB3-interacting and GLEBS motif-containing protein ZNF207 isoform X2 n=1 Tax=Ischnura elegans TaxID=197161 RepID=UPI001ED896C0|nr:BUB3-interacting and GLEBS motif-containing protein ZNF207 isoform X2 [Ischnura elegans]